jgi:hypothetical protein
MTAFGNSFSFMRKEIILIVFFYFSSCINNAYFSESIKISDAFFKGKVIVEKIEKLDKYRITIFDSLTGVSDHIYTPYEVFEMETGDINQDGRTDICIGIIKPTPYDPVLKKRLFIFQIDRDYIRPLWLSSRLVRPLEKFAVLTNANGCMIRTIEKENTEMFCINEYKWESFGMTFIKTRNDSLNYSDAQSLLLK